MDKYLICLKSKQLVYNYDISQNYEGELYVSNLGVLTYDISYKDINNMPSSIIILFEDDKLLSIKLVSQELLLM